MAITKQYLKSKPVVKVTFTVLGSFNGWSPKKAVALKKLKNGSFKGTVDLDKDNSYEFKYLVDDTYVNDEQADAYAYNEFGTENSVLNL